MSNVKELMQQAMKRDLTIQELYPNMEEYADNSQFHYWMDYAVELDHLCGLNYDPSPTAMIEYINKQIATKLSLSPQHHACTDVATTLESLHSECKGVFRYGA
jgi:hypothetical protein